MPAPGSSPVITVVPVPPGVDARSQVTVPPRPPDVVALKVTAAPVTQVVACVAVLVAQVGSATWVNFTEVVMALHPAPAGEAVDKAQL